MGNTSGFLARQASSDYDISIGVVLLVYSFILFVFALWGYLILPENCINDTVRSNGRYTIILSCMMMVIYGSFFFCKFTCMKYVKGDEKTILKADPNPSIPGEITLFTLIASLAYTSMMITQINYINSRSKCQGSSFSSWKMSAYLASTLTGLISLFIVIYYVYERRNKLNASRREREAAVASSRLD